MNLLVVGRDRTGAQCEIAHSWFCSLHHRKLNGLGKRRGREAAWVNNAHRGPRAGLCEAAILHRHGGTDYDTLGD